MNDGKHTLEMGVDNTGFIVDRLGRDCARFSTCAS